jgi:acetyl-CoA synthetase
VPEVVWRPDEATIERANATRLLRRSGAATWAELQERSWREPEWFWPLCIDDMGLEFSTPWEQVVDDSRGPEWATWFVGGNVSIAHNCVHRWAARRPEAPAAIGLGEDGSRRTMTFAELSRDVTRLAERLAELGVEPGDRVAIFLPMSPDVAVASNAIAHLGAIQVPIFSGFAAPAVAQRLEASEAKVVLTQHESSRRGKTVPMLSILEEAMSIAGSAADVVLAPFELDAFPGALPALEVDSEHPYLLTYTSGTTGKPKGVVHVQGGFLVSIAREVAYQADVHEGDVVHFATDMTRPARPASRKASCTCRAGSSSRSPARSRTRPTCTRATSCTSPRTWAGSWARGPSSASARSAARSSSPKARRTGRPRSASGRRSRRNV